MLDDVSITPEQELLEYVERLGRFGYAGRQALHLRFSALHAMYQHPDYFRIAVGIFADQIAAYGGRYYPLSNGDVVYVAREASSDELDEVIARIRLLFSEDPNVATKGAAGQFFTRYALDTDYWRLLSHCRELNEQAMAQRRETAYFEQLVLRPVARPVTPEDVTKLENAMPDVDMASVLQKQAVCTLAGNAVTDPIFDEVYVSISDLRTFTGMHFNPYANRWLFQYLTQVLDRHVLTYLSRDDVTHARPISLNLNVGTILTPAFQKFNDTVAPRSRHTLVIEFNKIDVFADMGAFLFVRDYLRERGYRICLDGLNHLTAPYYDRKKLGFDLVKIHWSPDSLNSAQSEIVPVMQKLIKDIDQARVILCHCDSSVAVTLGQQLGIVMYQGREIDRMLAQRKDRFLA